MSVGTDCPNVVVPRFSVASHSDLSVSGLSPCWPRPCTKRSFVEPAAAAPDGTTDMRPDRATADAAFKSSRLSIMVWLQV